MIPPGIPASRSGWPGGLLEHLLRFRQGDVVEGFPAVYLGDPAVAVHAQTAAYRDQDPGPIEFPPFRYGLITTQTCDIQEEDAQIPSRPWVQVSPVYDAAASIDPSDPDAPSYFNSGHRRLLEKGRGFQYLMHLPRLGATGEFWIVDLRMSVAVDKGWLLTKSPIEAFTTFDERVEVGRRCAMLLDRPAFDGRFVEAVQQPLVRSLRQLAKTDEDLYQSIHESVHAVAVRARDNIQMLNAEVWIIGRIPVFPDPVNDWLLDMEAEWLALAEGTGLNLLPVRRSNLETMSAADYVALTVVPLVNISPDPTWHGGS